MNITRSRRARIVAPLLSLASLVYVPRSTAATPNNADIVQKIDSAVRVRDEAIESYTVTEHYAVFRGQDENHPAAEMVVRTTYRKDGGKSYSVLEQSGSEILRKQVLDTVLDHEKQMSQPVNRVTAVITSANYDMNVKGTDMVDGHDCIIVSLKPRHTSPYLFNGEMSVDAQDGSIVRFNGIASKSASVFAGPAQVSRQYTKLEGFPMAVHAQAISNSWILGKTIIKIDYTGYEIHTQFGN